MKILSKISILASLVILLNSCKKESTPQPATPATPKVTASSSAKDTMVLTPAGWLPKSHVFLVEKGFHLDVSTGHVLKIKNADGKIMADFGQIHSMPIDPKNNPKTPLNKNPNSVNSNSLKVQQSLNSTTVPGGSDGWVAYSYFFGNQPINYFSTTWTVPGNPTTNHSQTIFIFNALQNNDIVQPVLQWGGSSAGGGNYWTIGNWYGWDNNQYFAFTSLISVNPGTSLQGIISNTGMQSDGSYNFSVGFSGYSNTLNITEGTTHSGTNNGSHTTVTFPYIGAEMDAFETIESYNNINYNGGNGVTASTDYPSQAFVAMNNISISSGGSPISLFWGSASGTWAVFGEHASVINNASNGTGEVDLYFHPQPIPPSISYSTPQSYYTWAAITPLAPSNSVGAATSYSVSPALPAGLSLNTSTGVISGTPTTATAAANYTVTATNSAGSSSFAVNITIAIPPNYTISFDVATSNAAATYFILTLSTGANSGPRAVSASNPIVVATSGYSSNTTVTMQITSGYMPVSASIYGFWGHSTGVISGNTITFSNVNLSATQSLNLNLN